METLDVLKTIFGVIGGAFTVIGGVYGFIRWLRHKPEETDSEDENDQSGRRGRRRQPNPATHSSMLPWILVGLMVLMWCSFGGLVVLGMLMSTEREPYPPPPPPPTPDVSGNWMELGGNIVSVTQQGNSVTMQFPLLAQWGTPPTLTGTIQPSSDPRSLAVVQVAYGRISAQFYLVDGNRMEGTVRDGTKSTAAVLYRQR
jgi:hypothetical protein